MYVMEKTVASSNRASGRSNLIKDSIVDPVEDFWLVSSVIIFKILYIWGLSPEGMVIGMTQNMVFVSETQLLNRDSVEFIA